MSLRRESDGDDEDEEEEDDEDEAEDAPEAVRFLGVNVEGSALIASYVGRRSIVLGWMVGCWVRGDWCMMTGNFRMVLYSDRTGMRRKDGRIYLRECLSRKR